MAKNLKLKRRKRERAERGAILTGKPLRYSSTVASGYERELKALIDPMRKEYEAELHALINEFRSAFAMDANAASQARILLAWLGKKWAERFFKSSDTLVGKFIERVNKAEKVSINASLAEASGYLTIKVPEMPGDLKEKLTASAAENTALIRSIQAQYHERITSSIMVSLQNGGKGAATIMDELRHIGGLSEKRAHLIAIDQTRKITTAMNIERAKGAGVKKFRWLHSGRPATPRHSHVEMNGQIFEYDNPPVIDPKTGERGFPGQLINCSCVAVPVIEFD